MHQQNALQRYYPWLLVVMLFFTSVVSYLDRNIISLFVGPIRQELALSDVQVSLLQGVAFALFYSVMGLPFGRLVDHHTRKSLIAAGILLWSVMTICCGLRRSRGPASPTTHLSPGRQSAAWDSQLALSGV